MIKVIDTFKDYIEAFNNNPSTTIEQVKDTWELYIKQYPKLEFKMKNSYEEYGYNWLEYGKEHVFNVQKHEYPRMLEAYNHLQDVTPRIIKRAEDLYGIDFDINIIYYAGLHNSAGWVDYYNDQMAIFIGIDKIAELEWQSEAALETLMAHELCHALHYNIRDTKIGESGFNTIYESGIWDLYEEGFAKYFENTLINHKNSKRGDQWFKQCKALEKKLKTLYLKALANQEIGTRDFYGDWYQVEGLSDVGYFLGAEMMEILHKTMDFKTIACLSHDQIINHVLNYLKE